MGLLESLGLVRAPIVTPSVSVVEDSPSKAVIGPGATAIGYDYTGGYGRWDTPRGMKRAEELSHANPWVDKAERLITGRASGLPWHLEDAEGETVDDDSPPQYQAVRDLLERPSPGRTWRELTKMTYRHMGVINVGAWYLDSLDTFGIPSQILYLNPARLSPNERGGVLQGWILDKDNEYGWNPRLLSLDEVLLFILEPPDFGYFGQGLVEVATSKRRLSESSDRYATQTLASGGRKGSWIMPREGRLEQDVYDGLTLAMRNVRESPDSANRDIVSKAPLDITPQAATSAELQSAEIMAMSRDDLLVIWGVDVQDAGIPGGAGLSSGQLRQQARQSTYENAVDPRVDVLGEIVQLRLLDRWKAAGVSLELVIERPTWEDETPAYEQASKAREMPLRNAERRAILGLDPFGDPVLDNAVWLPAGISEAYMAPDADGVVVQVSSVETALIESGASADVTEQKASLGRTRQTVDARVTPQIRRAVEKVLADTKADVVRLVADKASHLANKPADVRAVFNETAFAKAMRAALEPHQRSTAIAVTTVTKEKLGHLNPAKADPPSFLDSVTDFVLRRGGERIVEMTATTRKDIIAALQDTVTAGVTAGTGPAELARNMTDAVGKLPTWSDERAEMIARTETMFAYNDSAIRSYGEYGVERVEAIDGDGDPECAERNGKVFTLDEALGIADHPNGSLDWLPIL